MAKDALNGIVTRYIYKHNDLTKFFSKTVILFIHKMSYIKHKFENSYQFHHDSFIFERRRPLLKQEERKKQCIMGSVSSTSIMDFHKPPTVDSFLSVTTWCFLTNLVSIWRLLSPCWSAFIIAWYMLIYYNETSCVRGECIIHEGPFWSRDDDRRITLERAYTFILFFFFFIITRSSLVPVAASTHRERKCRWKKINI